MIQVKVGNNAKRGSAGKIKWRDLEGGKKKGRKEEKERRLSKIMALIQLCVQSNLNRLEA